MTSIDTDRALSERPSPLISADQLEDLLGEPKVKIFDIRGTWKSPARALPQDYAAGHIPGAVFLDWTAHFIDTKEEIGLASVADSDQAADSFRALGINKDDVVILYDDYHHMLAGRIWWAMHYWGFATVRVLET